MISSEVFWQSEKGAPLLKRNAGYLSKSSVERCVQRAAQWVELAQEKEQITPIDDHTRDKLDAATLRIFELDAERTFSDAEHKKEMVELLTSVHHETRDYHQGLGFIVAFLLLQLDRKDVERIVISLHRHYLPGYFKAAAVNYVRDAKVFEKILLKHFPDAGKKIIDSVAAEAYCSKWFVGLNIHVLTFEALADFFDGLLAKGNVFLYQFGLSLVKNCEYDIMTAKDVGQVLAILRLDPTVYANTHTATPQNLPNKKEKLATDTELPSPETAETDASETSLPGSFFTKIVEDAVLFDIGDVDIDGLRKEVEDEMADAAERRRKRDAELGFDDDDDEIWFSDEEEEEGEDAATNGEVEEERKKADKDGNDDD